MHLTHLIAPYFYQTKSDFSLPPPSVIKARPPRHGEHAHCDDQNGTEKGHHGLLSDRFNHLTANGDTDQSTV